MLGNPKYKLGDIVRFKIKIEDRSIPVTGRVYIVDPYGTFDQNEHASYDIMSDHSPFGGSRCLFKHIEEPQVEMVKTLEEECENCERFEFCQEAKANDCFSICPKLG